MDLHIHIPKDLEIVLSDIPDKQAYAIDAMRKQAEQDKADYDKWASEQIQEGLEAIKRGDIASDEEVKAYFKKRGVDA
ncbi:MAG: hypothetical protein HQL71_15025 [Magnetococcales bacterium]|nr:hypothetical protein [Magnetococcales bacterium]